MHVPPLKQGFGEQSSVSKNRVNLTAQNVLIQKTPQEFVSIGSMKSGMSLASISCIAIKITVILSHTNLTREKS